MREVGEIPFLLGVFSYFVIVLVIVLVIGLMQILVIFDYAYEYDFVSVSSAIINQNLFSIRCYLIFLCFLIFIYWDWPVNQKLK